MPIFRSTSSFGNGFVQKNQSQHVTPSGCFSPSSPFIGTITSSPGRQSAGSAIRKASMVCYPISTRSISSKLRPSASG